MTMLSQAREAGLECRPVPEGLRPLRFVCDEMLARLARLLRAAGYDAWLAETGAADTALVEVARIGRRVLITRDRRLADTAALSGLQALMLEADRVTEQAAELARAYPVDWLHRPLTRCLVDNAPLRAAGPAEMGAVPAGARRLAGPFTACPICRRIFWPGSHARRIMSQLAALAGRESPAIEDDDDRN